MSGKKLILTEKPSVAQTISAVLGANKRRDGFFEGGDSGDWLISWCYGHLVELAPADAYGEQYKRWSYDSLPILPDVWKYRASEGKKKQLDILRTLMNRADVDSVIIATDAGREGELIGRLVYEQTGCSKPMQRLWLMSLEDSAIREGFNNLRPSADFDNLYHAALCRAKADYMVGINATRLFTCLYGLTLNVGRVQSPTLALIVNREAAVQGFVSEPFYTPEIYCGGFGGAGAAIDDIGDSDGTNGGTNGFTARGERLTDAEVAEVIRSAADGQDAVVVSVEKQRKTTAPPKLYDLTSLQREANRLFGFTAQQTLDYAQSLYERWLITYPRTDSRYLSSDMHGTVTALVEWIQRDMDFNDGADFTPDVDRVIKDSGITDHHAIIPTHSIMNTDTTALPNSECLILNLIACRLLCAVAPVHVYETTTAALECGGHRFTAKGKTTIADGWKSIDNTYRATLKNKPEDDAAEADAYNIGNSGENSEDSDGGSALPELTEGQVLPSVAATVREGRTSSPKRYNDATLLSAMETAGIEDFPDDVERKGLGTPATRAATIEKIIKTGFVERQKKSLVPTAKGINLISVLPDDIKSPLLTAEWEQRLKLVELGELSDAEFLDGIAALTQELVASHRVPVPEYAALFATEPSNNTVVNLDAIIGNCPRCKSPVVEKPKNNGSKGKGGGKMPDYYCTNRACRFCLWRDNRFFEAKRKKLDKKTAVALLTEGRIFFSDLHSEKTGKTYAATIILDDDGERVNFKLEFTNVNPEGSRHNGRA